MKKTPPILTAYAAVSEQKDRVVIVEVDPNFQYLIVEASNAERFTIIISMYLKKEIIDWNQRNSHQLVMAEDFVGLQLRAEGSRPYHATGITYRWRIEGRK